MIFAQPELFPDPAFQAIFSDCGTYRFFLEIRWDSNPAVACVMTNPSLAGSAKPTDLTTIKCCCIWRAWGFGAHRAVNAYPYISPDPKAMLDYMDELPAADYVQLIAKNDEHVLAACKDAGIVVVAWGNNVPKARAGVLTSKLLQAGHKLYCLGTNKDGSPRHPLSRGKNHVPVDQKPVLWRAA